MALEVFHQFRENLKSLSSEAGSRAETSEYASELSEDYNSVDGSFSEARCSGQHPQQLSDSISPPHHLSISI